MSLPLAIICLSTKCLNLREKKRKEKERERWEGRKRKQASKQARDPTVLHLGQKRSINCAVTTLTIPLVKNKKLKAF